MFRYVMLATLVVALSDTVAEAQICPNYTYTLTNGSTADANQVMGNFNSILLCANNNLAPLANPTFSGNVSLPVATGSTAGNLFLGGNTASGSNGLRLFSNDAGSGSYIDTKASSSANGVVFRVDTANGTTERMRITAGGSVGIGTTVPADMLDVSSGVVRANGFRTRPGQGGAIGGNVFNIFWTGSGADLWIDTTDLGRISTTSDRRLKQHIEPIPAGLNRVMQLNPVTFKWRDLGIFHDDGITHEGFIADELQSVIPSAVSHGKDEVDDKGKAVYQTITPIEILPVLTKAIQEQQTQIEELRREIAALKDLSTSSR